jgi:hypothetical protein
LREQFHVVREPHQQVRENGAECDVIKQEPQVTDAETFRASREDDRAVWILVGKIMELLVVA